MLWRNGRVFKLRALNGRLANRCLSEKLNLLNSHCYQLTKTKYDVILITVNYLELPVYKQKQKILDALAVNQVIVVASPLVTEQYCPTEPEGNVLIFLPGEKAIKDTTGSLLLARCARDLEILPLYARLSSGEQERVFLEY